MIVPVDWPEQRKPSRAGDGDGSSRTIALHGMFSIDRQKKRVKLYKEVSLRCIRKGQL